jgi:hypothetical protein
MYRSVISFLTLLPLLLPPGLCLCHAPTAACAVEALGRGHDDGDGDDDHAPAAHFCLARYGHRHDDHGMPGKQPSHVPGCPAVKNLVHAGGRPGSLTVLLAHVFAGALPVLDATAPSSGAVVSWSHHDGPDESHPLYLSLRTLRI